MRIFWKLLFVTFKWYTFLIITNNHKFPIWEKILKGISTSIIPTLTSLGSRDIISYPVFEKRTRILITNYDHNHLTNGTAMVLICSIWITCTRLRFFVRRKFNGLIRLHDFRCESKRMTVVGPDGVAWQTTAEYDGVNKTGSFIILPLPNTRVILK